MNARIPTYMYTRRVRSTSFIAGRVRKMGGACPCNAVRMRGLSKATTNTINGRPLENVSLT